MAHFLTCNMTDPRVMALLFFYILTHLLSIISQDVMVRFPIDQLWIRQISQTFSSIRVSAHTSTCHVIQLVLLLNLGPTTRYRSIRDPGLPWRQRKWRSLVLRPDK